MWLNRTRLPHVLPSSAYFAPDFYGRELDAMFRPGWHFIGTVDELPRSGDFLTLELLGTPILVRNFAGKFSAFANVCAHRHSLLTSLSRGSAPRLRCQYHGWEYDADGAVCKIPDAACFTPVKRGSERLRAYRTERIGKLLFVAFSDDAKSLREQIGERSFALGERLFSSRFRQIVSREFSHPCNWKIPLENVLESYHVPALHENLLSRHPELFKVFTGSKRGDIVHEIDAHFSAYYDSLGADSRLYRALIEKLLPGASCDYLHHHVFPNLIFGHTSIVSFVQAVVPISATTSRSMIRLFFELEDGVLIRALSPLVKAVAARLIELVLREDAAVYPAVQRGMEASTQRGVLGSREERVHAFQEYVARATGLA